LFDKSFKETMEVVDGFRKGQASAVDKLVNENLGIRMKMYEKVTNSFSKFFNENELDKIINEKVDNRTMLRMA